MNQNEADVILESLPEGWSTYCMDWAEDAHVIFRSPQGDYYEADDLADYQPREITERSAA